MKQSNKYTLITGGSDGIGFELAKLFAIDKHNLVIVAINKEKLNKTKLYLESKYNIKVEIKSIDLSTENSFNELIKFIEDRNILIENLVNNAGIGAFGEFIYGEAEIEEKLININITILTKLTKYFLNIMVKNGYGGILNVASTAAFIGGPKMSIYYSSKAYVLSLTEAIHDEVKSHGIKVTCLCPGPVDTSFQKKSGIKKSNNAKKYIMSAEVVAKHGYYGFLKNKTIVIPGIKNKIIIFANRLAPRSLSRKIILKNNN